MDSPQIIAEKIKAIAKLKGVTVKETLLSADLPNSTVSNMLKGSMPSSDKLSRLATALGVSTDYLLGTTDDAIPPDTKNTPLEPMSSKEALKMFLIKEGIFPADRDITDEEMRTLTAIADAFFNKGEKR